MKATKKPTPLKAIKTGRHVSPPNLQPIGKKRLKVVVAMPKKDPDAWGEGLKVMPTQQVGPTARRKLIDQFEKDKFLACNHLAANLGVIVDYCEGEEIPYFINAHPGDGYVIFKNDQRYEGSNIPPRKR